MQDLLEILVNPEEYWPILVFVGGFLVVWGILVVAALTALLAKGTSWSTRHRKWHLGLALFSTVVAVLGLVAGSFRFQFEGQALNGNIDLKWLLVVPALLGALALRAWFRDHRQTSRP
jgi:hypothetical protein